MYGLMSSSLKHLTDRCPLERLGAWNLEAPVWKVQSYDSLRFGHVRGDKKGCNTMILILIGICPKLIMYRTIPTYSLC